jgi:SAM-dependent methyltransferase
MSEAVRRHYELYPYPQYPLLASMHRSDTYAINLSALWARFNGELRPQNPGRILIAGCGSFAPYPFALANPKSDITALDLSVRSLNRARLHCLLHGCCNVTFRCGDLLDPASTDGRFDLIDAYGVLHHLDDPLAGLRALGSRLEDGGILRIMVYSRYARREEESIRRAFRLLGVQEPAAAERLIRRSKPGSRLRGFIDASDEASYESGLADALLHPRVHTFRIDGFMELIRQSGLEPLRFAHGNALEDVGQEVDRIRQLEASRQSTDNFIVYLGRNVAGPCQDGAASLLMLNPCLSAAVRPLRIGPCRVAPRLGHPNQPLGRKERNFLRHFRSPKPWNEVPPSALPAVRQYIRELFLLRFRQDDSVRLPS